MAYSGKLRLGGNEYNLQQCHFSFKRNMEPSGKPSSKMLGGLIYITIESNNANSLIEFVLNNQSRPVDGSVIILNTSQESNNKEITFRKGFVIEYTEKIGLVTAASQLIDLVISAQMVKIGSAEYSSDWNF